MIQTKSLQKFLRLTKKEWNVYDLYIWHWESQLLTYNIRQATDTLSWQSMVNVLKECRPLYRPRYLPIVGWYIDHPSADISVDNYVSWYDVHWYISVITTIGRVSNDMLTDILVECRLICRPIHRLGVGRYVNRYIGRGVHKIHMILHG